MRFINSLAYLFIRYILPILGIFMMLSCVLLSILKNFLNSLFIATLSFCICVNAEILMSLSGFSCLELFIFDGLISCDMILFCGS